MKTFGEIQKRDVVSNLCVKSKIGGFGPHPGE